jgi:hypothetical protein
VGALLQNNRPNLAGLFLAKSDTGLAGGCTRVEQHSRMAKFTGNQASTRAAILQNREFFSKF